MLNDHEYCEVTLFRHKAEQSCIAGWLFEKPTCASHECNVNEDEQQITGIFSPEQS